jgi:hypothetical protein
MQIISLLLILSVLIGAFYFVKIKLDEGIITEEEKKQFKDKPTKFMVFSLLIVYNFNS